MTLNYNYDKSRVYCKQIGLHWLGDDFVSAADAEAYQLGFSQIQFDAAMRHHLWQVKYLFTPKSYSYKQRALLALYFLFGIGSK